MQCDATLLVRRPLQHLGHHCHQGRCQLHPNLLLLGGWKDIDQAVHGLRRRVRVQGAKDQVAGFRCCQRQPDGLQVPQLPHQDDVGILPQGAPERPGERRCVHPHLALVDDAVLGRVHELHRVLDGQDVRMAALVDVINHGRQGRALAGARGPRHQHQSPPHLCNIAQHTGGLQIIQRQHLVGNDPQHHAHATHLVVDVDAEAGEPI